MLATASVTHFWMIGGEPFKNSQKSSNVSNGVHGSEPIGQLFLSEPTCKNRGSSNEQRKSLVALITPWARSPTNPSFRISLRKKPSPSRPLIFDLSIWNIFKRDLRWSYDDQIQYCQSCDILTGAILQHFPMWIFASAMPFTLILTSATDAEKQSCSCGSRFSYISQNEVYDPQWHAVINFGGQQWCFKKRFRKSGPKSLHISLFILFGMAFNNLPIGPRPVICVNSNLPIVPVLKSSARIVLY